MTLKVLNVTTLIIIKSLNNSKLVTFKIRFKKKDLVSDGAYAQQLLNIPALTAGIPTKLLW